MDIMIKLMAGRDVYKRQDLEYAGLIATLIETVPEDSYQLAALLKTCFLYTSDILIYDNFVHYKVDSRPYL